MKTASNKVDVKISQIGGKPVRISSSVGELGERKRQKLLYVQGHARRSRCSCEERDEAMLLAHHCGFEIVSVEREFRNSFELNSAVDEVVVVWTALAREFNPACIGLFGESKFGALSAARILREIWQGAPTPGAVVLRAPGPDLIGECFGGERADGGRGAFFDEVILGRSIPAAPTSFYDSHQIEIEFPPTLVVVEAQDPLLGQTARTYRMLRRSGMPITMEVFEERSSVAGAEERSALRAAEQASEIARFFDQHLVEGFPRMLLEDEMHHLVSGQKGRSGWGAEV
jgi:epsilon-lactone hydrolase